MSLRFISPIGALRIVAIHDEAVPDPHTGRMVTVKPGYTVQFQQGVLSLQEKELARRELRFPGGVVDRRNVDGSPYDYVNTASVFDTGWIEDLKTRERVEKVLLKEAGSPSGYILVEEPKVSAPWPNYLEKTIHGKRRAEDVAAQNLEIAAAIGVGIDALIAYERQERNNPGVIAAYEAAKAVDEQAEELVKA